MERKHHRACSSRVDLTCGDVPKHDSSYRMRVDYHRLNAMIVWDTCPLARIEELVDCLEDALKISTLDVSWYYGQKAVAEKDGDKTTFNSHAGTYTFNRMLWELMSAPAKFQLALDIALNKYTWKAFLVYLANIFIFSKNNDKHLQNIENVFSTLYAAGVSLKLRKCQRLTTKVKYLCHTITPHVRSITKVHTEKLKDMKYPRTLTELRFILGMCNAHWWFVANFTHRTEQLNRLFKNNQSSMLSPLVIDQTIEFKTLIETRLPHHYSHFQGQS